MSVYHTALSELGLAANTIRDKRPLWTRRPRQASPITIRPIAYGVSASIIKWAAKRTGVSVTQLKGRSQKREVAHARFLTMWLLRNLQGVSTPHIGRTLNRDHTTVIHGLSRVVDLYPDLDDITARAAEDLNLE